LRCGGHRGRSLLLLLGGRRGLERAAGSRSIRALQRQSGNGLKPAPSESLTLYGSMAPRMPNTCTWQAVSGNMQVTKKKKKERKSKWQNFVPAPLAAATRRSDRRWSLAAAAVSPREAPGSCATERRRARPPCQEGEEPPRVKLD
jgi:hypothetical protein